MRESEKVVEMNSHSVLCSIMREPELQEFIGLKSSKHKLSYDVSDTVQTAVERFVSIGCHAQDPHRHTSRFYFSHYCARFVP